MEVVAVAVAAGENFTLCHLILVKDNYEPFCWAFGSNAKQQTLVTLQNIFIPDTVTKVMDMEVVAAEEGTCEIVQFTF